MEEKSIRIKLAEGYIHIRAIIEVVGKPEEYVKESLKSHMTKVKKDYEITKEMVELPVEQDGFFSTFGEIELIVKNSLEVLSFCFDYMPSSIEILAPESMILKNSDFTGFLNDMQARLHALNTGFIQAQEKNKFFIKNTAVLLRNFLVVLLSAKPLSIEKMRPYLGVKKEDIEKVLEVLIKESKIKKEGEIYKIK